MKTKSIRDQEKYNKSNLYKYIKEHYRNSLKEDLNEQAVSVVEDKLFIPSSLQSAKHVVESSQSWWIESAIQ